MISRTILLVVAPFIVIRAHADFSSAVQEYRAKNYSFAYAGFLESATLGDGAAQYNLAAMTWQGHGLPRDPATALGWLKAATTNGYQVDAAMMATVEAAVTPDEWPDVEAILTRYSRAAVEQNVLPRFDRPCRPWLRAVPRREVNPTISDSLLLRDGIVLIEFMLGLDGVPRDPEILVAHPGKALGAPAMSALLSSRFEPFLCDGKPCELRTSHRYIFDFSSATGLRPQQFARFDPSPAARDALWGEKVVEKARQLNERRDAQAQYWLGTAALADERFELTPVDAAKLIMAAAQAGHTDALYWIGRYIDDFEDCLGKDRAITWLDIAARNGHDRSRVLLARILLRHPAPTSTARAGDLLRAVEATASPIALKYAAGLLATFPNAEIREPRHALRLASRLHYDHARLDPHYNEVYAAALAANERFLHAYRQQRRAIISAKELGWNTDLMEERQDAYAKKQAWTGDLFLIPGRR